MSVSRRQNDITALKNIKISSGKSRKKPQFVTNPGKSTDSLTIETLFHVDTNCDFLNNVYVYSILLNRPACRKHRHHVGKMKYVSLFERQEEYNKNQ